MDNIGAEVGQKMRSAIKAKLMELDCYVDDELPDYIMVMVANKRTKSQMNEDLNLFLSTKTSTFVNWLHIVLKKLKEVTVTNPDIYKKVSKRKSDEYSEVKTKKEKRDKKVKKEEPSDVPDEKPIVKPEVEANDTSKHQDEKSLTDDLPLMAKPLSENRQVVLTGNEDGFDIPLMSEIQDCNEEDLDALEKKIKSVKSRLGMLVESDEEVYNISVTKDVNLETNEVEVDNNEKVAEETAAEEKDSGEGNEESESNNLADSRQISILENEISESHNKELERLTTALEQEENEEELESYTPKRKQHTDDDDVRTSTESNKEEENGGDKQKYPERKHERITFNPDEVSPKKPSVRERLGRKSSTSPEGPEGDRSKNSFYAGCEEERIKRNNPHRDFKEWVALRQRDKSRDKRDRSRERIRDRTWDKRGRSRERRDQSWNQRDPRENNWNRGDNRRDKSWNKRDKSWDRYERIREGRNRSRSVERRNRSRSREERNRSKEASNRNTDDTTKERRDPSDERKERVRDTSRSRIKEIRSEVIPSRLVMSKVSVPRKTSEPEKSDDEQVVREVQSLVKVKRTLRTGKTQPNKNLLLRAVAEAQRSVAQAPKSGLSSPKKLKSIQERLGTQQQKPVRTCRLMENEKVKLKSLLEQTRKNRILQRRLDLEGCDSSDGEYVPRPVRSKGYDSSEGEYIPRPMKKGAKVPKYVPSFKGSPGNSDKSSDESERSPKPQFVITLDGIDKMNKDHKEASKQEEKSESREKSPPKSRTDGRRVPSPIVFNKKQCSTQSAVKTPKPNIPDKLPVVHPPLSIKNKERCKYWPGCRQGDKCEFVHPSQVCETFPQCKSGDKCLYLHPKCKFGSSCTKKECPFDHNMAKPVIASKTLAPTQNCKFYPNCTNISCPFFHPKPCKYGKFCASTSDCPFLHNVTPKRSLSWSKAK